jgi:hypothetical protein
MAMQLVPLERILSAIRNKTDKKLFPGNEPATSWREERLLREIADSYFRSIIQPRLVDAWSKAGRAPTPGAQSLPLQASDMPDIDELRGLHDSPSAPPGPHVVPQEAVERAEPSPAVSAPASEENAPVSSTAQSGAIPGDRPAIDAGPGLDAAPASDLPDGAPPYVAAGAPEAQPTRASVLAAFNRNRPPPSPQPAPQPRPPERRMERQAEPKPRENLSEDAVDELIAGWQAGNLAWPRKLLGEEPGHPGCRLSREALRRNGLA